MEQYKEQIQAAFIKEVCKKGYRVELKHDKGQLMDFYKDNIYLGSLMLNERFRFPEDIVFQNEIHEIMDMYEKTKAMYKQYARAMPLFSQDLPNYRVLSECGMVLLAVKMRQSGSLEFVTWNYDYDQKGVNQGNYFEDNFEAAKKDYAIRSGLMPGYQVFNKDELKMIYQSCVFRGQYDGNITWNEEMGLRKLMEKIEDGLPELQDKMLDAVHQPDMEATMDCGRE